MDLKMSKLWIHVKFRQFLLKRAQNQGSNNMKFHGMMIKKKSCSKSSIREPGEPMQNAKDWLKQFVWVGGVCLFCTYIASTVSILCNII